MKYLMGLILSFTLGAAAFAQDNTKNDNCEDASASAKQTETPIVEPDQDFGLEDSTDMKTDIEADVETETEIIQESAEIETEPDMETSDASSAGGSVFTFGNECSLNGLLDDNTQGKYKFKQKLDGAELKVEREKDGDGEVKYESEDEYYDYERNEKGESEYSHGVAKGNESVEIMKNKDGSVDVFYQGHFNNLEEARALEKGLRFEGFESVCSR